MSLILEGMGTNGHLVLEGFTSVSIGQLYQFYAQISIELTDQGALSVLRKLITNIDITSRTALEAIFLGQYYEDLILRSKVTVELELHSYFGEKLTRFYS